MEKCSNAAGNSCHGGTFEFLQGLCVTILFPYQSILLIVHSCCLLTWRGRGSFLNTAYLLVCSSSTFSLVSLSLDTPIS